VEVDLQHHDESHLQYPKTDRGHCNQAPGAIPLIGMTTCSILKRIEGIATE